MFLTKHAKYNKNGPSSKSVEDVLLMLVTIGYSMIQF